MRILRPASLQRRVVLRGTGMYVPPRVVTNRDLIAMGARFEPGEVRRLTGIEQRRWVEPGVGTSDLAIHAGEAAMTAAGWAPESVDRVVVATVSPDYSSPSAACLVQHGLGLGTAPAHDVTASCSGLLYALDVAARCVLTGDDAVLAIAADVRSTYLHPSLRNTFALFADGAGAVAVGSHGVGPELEAITLAADGSGARSVYVPMGGSREPTSAQGLEEARHCIHMGDGAAVYFAAVDGMVEIGERLLSGCGLDWSDVHVLVPHQPNLRLLRRLAKVVGLPAERVYINLHRYGNVSGASCGIALHEVLQRVDLPPGARLLLLTAGAGYTAGAAIVRLPLERP